MRIATLQTELVSRGLIKSIADIVISYAEFSFNRVNKLDNNFLEVVAELADGRLVFHAANEWASLNLETNAMVTYIENEMYDLVICGKFAVVAIDTVLNFMDLKTSEHMFQAKLFWTPHLFSTDGSRLLIGNSDGIVQLWHLAPFKVVTTIEARASGLIGVALWRNFAALTISITHIEIWNLESEKLVRVLTTGTVSRTLFTSTGLLACLRGYAVQVWNIETGILLSSLEQQERIYYMAQLCCGKLVVVGQEKVELWDLAGKRVATHYVNWYEVVALRNGGLVACVGVGKFELFD